MSKNEGPALSGSRVVLARLQANEADIRAEVDQKVAAQRFLQGIIEEADRVEASFAAQDAAEAGRLKRLAIDEAPKLRARALSGSGGNGEAASEVVDAFFHSGD